MPVIDVCFFASRDPNERRNLELLIRNFIIWECAAVNIHMAGYSTVVRYSMRLWSYCVANEFIDALYDIGVSPVPDIFFTLPLDAKTQGMIHRIAALYLYAYSKIKISCYEAFPAGGDSKIDAVSYSIFLLMPEEKKKALAENFALKLRQARILPDQKIWNNIYIPEHLP